MSTECRVRYIMQTLLTIEFDYTEKRTRLRASPEGCQWLLRLYTYPSIDDVITGEIERVSVPLRGQVSSE